MALKPVGIRFAPVGKAEVIGAVNEIATAGDAAAKRYAREWDKAGRDAEAALSRQERAMEKLAAFTPGLNPTKLDMYAGVTDQTRKSAESSAAIFSAAYAQMEERAQALRAAIDPAFAAQQRFDAEIAEARTLLAGGAISLDDYSKRAWQLHQTLTDVGDGAKRSGNAFALAAPQIQDFVIQATMGGNPIQALAVQGGQLAGQLIYVEGAAGKAARAFMGPWGIAFQVALMVLSPFVAKLWEEDEAGKAAAKAAEEHRKAVVDLQAAQEKAIQTADRKQAIDVATLKIELDRVIATRQQTQALLEQAIAQERVDKQRASAPGQRGELGALAAADSSARASGLEALLAQNTTELKAAQRGFDLGFARLIGMKVDDRSTPEGRVRSQYATARMQAEDELAGQPVKLRARIEELNKVRDEELKRIRDAEAATRALGKATNQFGREVTSAQAATIARSAGFQVNSADRSYATQKRLYDDWVAAGKPANNPVAKPGSSAHERGNALDIQMSAGVTVTKIKAAFEAEGVRLTKIITEKGHWHVEWARTAAEKQADKDQAKDIRDAAAAQRQLKSDLDDTLKSLDPTRAAAADYADQLAKITALVNGGKLSMGEGVSYTLEAARQELARRQQAANDNARSILGIGDDPLADTLGNIKDSNQAASSAWFDEFNKRAEAQKSSIQSLAGFYQQIFSGGTKSIWDLFRQQGLRVLSELLAKWTLGNGASGLLSLLGLAGKAGGGLSGIREAANAGSSVITAPDFLPIPGHAVGTEYSSAGVALLGENGPELVNLPRGSRVTPAAETRRLMAGNDNARTFAPYFDLRGAVVTQDLLDQMNMIGAAAAAQGGVAGSALAQEEAAGSQRRALGRNWGR